MPNQLNFEAEPFQNEDAFGETSEEVRDHRSGARGAFPVSSRPRVFSAPVFRGGSAFRGAPFIRPRIAFGGGFGTRRGFGFRRAGFPFRRRRFSFLMGPGQFGGISPFGASAAVSELVSWAQSCLSQMGGASIPQNGILGPATRQAISTFQSQQQLAPTGVLDNDTIAALQAACSQQGAGDPAGDGAQ
jgi:hypothetical protein